MTFQVYYRKWRPQTFRDLVGQDHVSGTLLQAVKLGRIAHSYLFCGPRGTGKTSTARILAKASNCLGSDGGNPCDTCSRCRAVSNGSFMDLIELDAASNRGIDEIRNIRDKVNLAPAEGTYKVYIIDEAHMLTEHASNAFLKTLEEPPGHAIFVLCTTESHKILPTIVSRCQRFDFRRISADTIIQRLRDICRDEGVAVDNDGLTALARLAGGSLRDAENLLEQLVVSYGDRIGIQEVHQMLGLVEGDTALELTGYLLMGNTPAALASVNRAAWDGGDIRQLHRQTLELLRGVLMLQCGSRDSLDLPKQTVRELEDLAQKSSMPGVMKSLKLLGEVDLRQDGASALPFELAVVEAGMEEPHKETVPEARPTQNRVTSPQPNTDGPRAQPVKPTAGPTPPPPRVQKSQETPIAPSQPASVAPSHRDEAVPQVDQMRTPPVQYPEERESKDLSPASATGTGDSESPFEVQWNSLVKTLSRSKGVRFSIGALLRDCREQHIEGETLVLTFAHRTHLERMQGELDDPQGVKMVMDAMLKSLGNQYQLKLILESDSGGSPSPPATQSPLVKAALSMGARVMEERAQ